MTVDIHEVPHVLNKYQQRALEAEEWVRENGPKLNIAQAGAKKGNRKLHLTRLAYERVLNIPAEIAAFNLVAGKVGGSRGGGCIGADECDDWCYAQANNFEYPNVDMSRRRNRASLNVLLASPTSSAAIINIHDELLAWILSKQGGARVVRHFLLRIHDSGDFFSAKYCEAWAGAIIKLRDTLSSLDMGSVTLIPYAYTKSYRLKDSMILLAEAGVRLVQSLESKWPEDINWDLPVAAVFKRGVEIPLGWENGNTPEMADLHAILGTHRIALPHHGSKGRSKVGEPLMQIALASER
jgi:hypothetical protein